MIHPPSCTSLRGALRIARCCLIAFLTFTTSQIAAAERGTREEAQAMVEGAIALFDSAGPEAALEAFNAPDPAFRDRDLYIFVVGPDGAVVGHAFDPNRPGLEVRNVKDRAGKPYGQQILDDATAEGVWIDYLRTDPETGEERHKSSWVKRHEGYIFGVGVYK